MAKFWHILRVSLNGIRGEKKTTQKTVTQIYVSSRGKPRATLGSKKAQDGSRKRAQDVFKKLYD